MLRCNIYNLGEGIRKIVVYVGWVIDGININGKLTGGTGGVANYIELKSNEEINRIYGFQCRIGNVSESLFCI